MLYVSLGLSLPLLLAAHYAARQPDRWPAFAACGAGLAFLPMCIGLALPPVWLLALFLAAALAVWPHARRRVPTFLPLSAAAFVAAYGVAGWSAARTWVREDRLRQQYPLRSMADRVPAPAPADRGAPLPEPTAARLVAFEVLVEGEGGDVRAYYLRHLHEETVEQFVNSFGFGVGRMVRRPTEASLRNSGDRGEAPAQPGSPLLASGRPGVPTEDRDALTGLHADGVLDFVNLRGFGYVRDRGHVAGFLPHGFSRVPPSPRWAVQTVELVGLLRHPTPVVYPSARLPAMDELKSAPTRPLDEFESAGLVAVRRGEDVFAARVGDGVRFVGAVRSARQCVECHGGKRGDLLGAFSYSLRPAEPVR